MHTYSAPLSPSGRAGFPTGAAAGSSPDLAASLSHRGLVAARAHAVLCGEVERCAPEVTATELQAAYDRMRLGLYVFYHPNLQRYVIGHGGRLADNWLAASHDRDEITRVYLRICAEVLSRSTPASPGNSAAGAVR